MFWLMILSGYHRVYEFTQFSEFNMKDIHLVNLGGASKIKFNHDLQIGSTKIEFCGKSDGSSIEIPLTIGVGIMPDLVCFLPDPATASYFKTVVIFPEASTKVMHYFSKFLRYGRVVCGQLDMLEVVYLLLNLGVEMEHIVILILSKIIRKRKMIRSTKMLL